jgi:hypothetical protein
MTKCKIKKNELAKFLSSFGPGVEDLRLDVKENGLVGGVALSTHFITQRVTVEQEEAGGIIIADLAKTIAFLRACSDDVVSLNQDITEANTGNLRLTCGNSTINLPPTQKVRSSESLPMATNLVNDASADNWETFGGDPLTCYGIVDINDLSQVSALGKVVGVDKPYQFLFIHKNTEGVINTGDAVSGQMFHKFHIEDATSTDGDGVIKTRFGPWFPEVIACLPPGKAELYTGADSVLVFNHQDKDCLLVVIDQDAGDE